MLVGGLAFRGDGFHLGYDEPEPFYPPLPELEQPVRYGACTGFRPGLPVSKAELE
jgi:hypothetical protein